MVRSLCFVTLRTSGCLFSRLFESHLLIDIRSFLLYCIREFSFRNALHISVPGFSGFPTLVGVRCPRLVTTSDLSAVLFHSAFQGHDCVVPPPCSGP